MYPLRQLGILLIKEFHFCFKLYPGKITNKSNYFILVHPHKSIWIELYCFQSKQEKCYHDNG